MIEPLIPSAKRSGRPRSTDVRRLLDGLFYVVRTGCQWRHLPPPPAFPSWPTVYRYFRAFLEAGVWEALLHLLVMLREQEGHDPTPSAAALDTQSVKTTEKGVPEALTRPGRSRVASVTSPSAPRASCSAYSYTPLTSRTPTAPERC